MADEDVENKDGEENEETISQEEIDTLLGGVEDEKVALEDPELTDNELRYYDFAAQERNVSGRLSGLFAINERFSRTFRTSLMNLLHRQIEVSVLDISTIKVSEYFASLESPACINLMRMRPLIGTGLCVLGTKLVFGLVDSLFGGQLDEVELKKKTEYTVMEMRIVNLVSELVYEELSNAWHPIIPIKIEEQGFELNPNLLNFVGPNEMIVVKKFKVELETLTDELHISLPYSMIEPIRSTLEVGSQTEQADVNERWANDLREEVFDAPLTMSGDLAETQSTFRKILEFKEGDLLPLEMNEFITVLANGIPTFRGKYGVSNGHSALKILGRVKRD